MSEKLSDWKDCWKKPVKVRFREVKFRELINTREGTLFAYPDKDYIIEGIEGEQYPIKKDIFDKTYSLTNEVEALEDDKRALTEIRKWFQNLICKKCIHPERSCICEVAGKTMPYRLIHPPPRVTDNE